MEPGQFYLIYNHANGTENIFREEENYLFFLKRYASYLDEVVDTYAYCLISNQFHLMIEMKVERLPRRTFSKFQTLEKLIQPRQRYGEYFQGGGKLSILPEAISQIPWRCGRHLCLLPDAQTISFDDRNESREATKENFSKVPKLWKS